MLVFTYNKQQLTLKFERHLQIKQVRSIFLGGLPEDLPKNLHLLFTCRRAIYYLLYTYTYGRNQKDRYWNYCILVVISKRFSEQAQFAQLP